MQIISRIDAAFFAFYALLIPLVGALLYVITGRALVLLMVPLLLTVYLSAVLPKPLRRRRAAALPFPTSWRDFLVVCSAYYRGLDESGKKKFERDIALFLSGDSIVAIGGKEVAWQTRLRIGAGVAAMLHGRPGWEPPLPDGVTVYPGSSFDLNYQAGKGTIAGQAPEGGPLLIAEDNLALRPGAFEPGRNILVHELAHFFDREQRKAGNGFPVRSRRGEGASWADFLTTEWQRHLRCGSILPSYAAVNEAEFFAVACELFFEDPHSLHAAHPELYALLGDFFNQDPRRVLTARSN
ncbi:MAG TPA: zinc-dependent peptidase [Candidatus Binatia bacterium]|nr:zinc-dependent peptidase [Candidatus Binatia bacterium]